MTSTVNFRKSIVRYGKVGLCFILEAISFAISIFFKPKRCTIPPIENQILLMPAIKLSKKIKTGELSSEQVIETYIRRIKKVNPIINAVIDTRFGAALDLARQLDEKLKDARNGTGDKSLLKLPLVGVPLTIKETVACQGSSYTAGLPQRKFKRASQSNKAVQQLIEDGGLIPIGSTNTPCMNLWSTSANLLHGQTKNPYDLSRIVGGSSGGEAANLAAAGSVVGVGSDLGGSIRIPCNFCGIFGHKPTPLTVSNDFICPILRKSQHKLMGIGPMTRYACDLLPMLKIMLSDEGTRAKMRLDEPVDLKKLKIYYCEELGDPCSSKCNSNVLSGLRAAVEHLNSTFDVPTKKINLNEFRYGLSLWSAEVSAAEGDVFSSEHEDGRVKFDPFKELIKKATGGCEFPLDTIFTVLFLSTGAKFDTPKHKYLTKKAESLRNRFYDLVGDDGVLLMPTYPQPAPHHQAIFFKFLNSSYTAVGNTLQAPITQCPLGMTREGLPFGLQVIAKPFNDRLTLAIALELENAFGGWLPPSRVAV